MISAFFRLHTTQVTNLGGNPSPGFATGSKVCKLFDSSRQIGCLVKASPCSIGFGERSIVDRLPSALNNFAYQLGTAPADAKPPTDTNILALLAPVSTVAYPLSFKVFVNHWVDPALPTPPNAANEEFLYNCFKDASITNPVISQFGFIPPPGGPEVADSCSP